MSHVMKQGMSQNMQDPNVPDWNRVQLPDSWADQLRWWWPLDMLKVARKVLGRPQRVRLPADMPGAELLPKYILQEFHNVPNGNYSKRLTGGYIAGFDRMMLGSMREARQHIARFLNGCDSVLDVGTAGGRTAASIKQHGASEVWGLDPSPYLLQHAARHHQQIHFVQGTAENIPFPAARFDGVAVCFVFHEMPPKHVLQAFKEFRRVLKPQGLLAICEPSAAQLDESIMALWRRYGWRGAYFYWLAHFVHEPFVRAWHRIDLKQALHDAGFEIVSDEEHFPARHVYARVRA